jgi:uncharacterized protein YcbX
MAELKRISRFPVKGLSPESLAKVAMTAGRGVPHDREFALALADTDFDEAHPRPLPKTKFAVLARFERLAALQTEFNLETSRLSLSHGGSLVASGSLETEEGRRTIERTIDDFCGEELGGTPRVVKGNGHRFTDISVHSPVLMEAVSIINLATVRALADALERPVDYRRFRGNLLIDGIEPWAEFDLIDRSFAIGDVLLRGVKKTKRCPATEVNPDTAERDIRVPLELLNRFGHGDLGIYVTIERGGDLRVGDRLAIPD